MCFGALMVGHSHPLMVDAIARAAAGGTLYGMPHDREVRAAELICERFRLEQMRFTNSGSEATMHALRLARAYTGRDKVLKFEGGYHGGHDTVLVSVKPPRHRVGREAHPKPLPVGHGIPALNIAALESILTPEAFPRATALGDALAEGHNAILQRHGLPFCAVNIGVNGTVYWRKTPPTNYREWLDQDFAAFWRYWHMNLNRGVIPQAQCFDEQWTVSVQHDERDVERMLSVFDEICREMK